jgi:hypothetical protein
MDILFILFGVAIFYAAAAVFALEHFEINPAQAIVSFLIPPFAWWLYYHHWQRSQRIAYAQIVAVALLTGGLLLMTWFSGTEFKILEANDKSSTKEFDSSGYVGSNKSLADLSKAERVTSNLNGRIRGYEFIFDSGNDVAEFDSLGTLRIKKGLDFFGEFEIAIEFNAIPKQSKEDWVKTIRADDKNAPTIYISWYDNDKKSLQSRKYQEGYNLDLRLTHQEYNFYDGKLQLVLPDPKQSFVVGSLPIYSSRLRFHGEGVNKEHDSTETLEVIATQSLQATYRRYVDTIIGFQDTEFDFRSGSGLGYSNVFIKDKEDIIKKVPLQFYKNENGWYLDVKGLKERLKSQKHVTSLIPKTINKPIRLDDRNIGRVEVVDKSESVEQVSTQITDAQLSKQQLVDKEASSAVNMTAEQQTSNTNESSSESISNNSTSNGASTVSIDIMAQEEEIETLLKPLMNKDVELVTREGKFKNGIYVGINRKQVVLEVSVGGGFVEFLTEYRNMKTLRVLNSPNTLPQKIDFYLSESP